MLFAISMRKIARKVLPSRFCLVVNPIFYLPRECGFGGGGGRDAVGGQAGRRREGMGVWMVAVVYQGPDWDHLFFPFFSILLSSLLFLLGGWALGNRDVGDAISRCPCIPPTRGSRKLPSRERSGLHEGGHVVGSV